MRGAPLVRGPGEHLDDGVNHAGGPAVREHAHAVEPLAPAKRGTRASNRKARLALRSHYGLALAVVVDADGHHPAMFS